MNPLETYLKELSEIRSSGAAVKETSYYGPMANILNEIGKTLKPKESAFCHGGGGPESSWFPEKKPIPIDLSPSFIG